MSTTTEMTRPLPADHLACGGCGVAARHDPETDPAWFAARDLLGERGASRGEPPLVTACEACTAALEGIEQIARRGGLDPRRVADAARAVRILSAERPATDAAWWSAAHYVGRALARAGYPDAPIDLRFEASEYVRHGRAASSPWSWLDADLRDRLARALQLGEAEAVALAELPTLQRVTLGHGRGCASCGVDGVVLPSVTVYRARTPQAAAEAAFKTRAGMRLCPACFEAPGARGGVAQAAALATVGLLAEVEAAEAIADAGERRLRWPKVTPWAKSGAKASPEPWAHIDIGVFAREVREILNRPRPMPLTLDALDARIRRIEEAIDFLLEGKP